MLNKLTTLRYLLILFPILTLMSACAIGPRDVSGGMGPALKAELDHQRPVPSGCIDSPANPSSPEASDHNCRC